jgi:uncharacterized membrane protein
MLLPPIPGWDALHPIVVHFAIALLFVAPIFVLLAFLPPPRGTCFSIAALVLMALGSACAVAAVSTGEDSARMVDRGGKAEEVILKHQSQSENARTAFIALTGVYAALTAARLLRWKDENRKLWFAVWIAFLVLYAGGLLLLTHAGYSGGRLVHEFGLHALMK